MKIHVLPGQLTTPEIMLAQLLECSDEIKAIAIVVLPKEGPTETFCTSMTDGDMAWLRWCFDQDFRPSSGSRTEHGDYVHP